ncbi:30S ribosomal protein S6 [Spiroplasma turonicum]|uniref:Small ribosomal subunit protein bS6 n=1 Tax=Spiroplasma turonicum TaxID=216946 RepID=A0A0K1P5S1_9MOLU|nr:30S ribosomal protein S6 [Spiroplasma turonicum]AKU79267.1 30S ribosomal protein S6 [Spiroplasma turonicum]ALX70290.1 30S ribosomal protein S6 [Spiroplasma turonicum]
MIRKYEIMYIVDKDVDDVKQVEKKLNDILTANSGKILESENWGLKDFAYEINKKKKGHYIVLIVETDSTNIAEFERISRIDKNVVRYLVINTENEKNYIQSTKYAKTDMSKYKEERKPNRPYERRFKKDDNFVEKKEAKEEAKESNVEKVEPKA